MRISLLQRRSLRLASSSVTPWTRSSLRRPLAPVARSTCRRGTPSVSATRRTSSAFALPSWAGAASRKRRRPSATPATSLRGAPGVTQTARLTPSAAARSGPSSPLELVLVHPAVDVRQQIVRLAEQDALPGRRPLGGVGPRLGGQVRRRRRSGVDRILGRRLLDKSRERRVVDFRRRDLGGHVWRRRRLCRRQGLLAGDGLLDGLGVTGELGLRHAFRRRHGHAGRRILEVLEVALQQLAELEAEVLLGALELGHRLLDALSLAVNLVDQLTPLELGLVQDELGLLGAVPLELVGAGLRRDQGLLEGLLDALVTRDPGFERLHAFAEVDVVLEHTLELVGDLVEELVDLHVGVAAHTALELLVADVQRCE